MVWRTFRVLKGGVQRRMDHITKVKGVLFSPVTVEETVRSMPELGNEYELIIANNKDIDVISLNIEIIPQFENKKSDIVNELLKRLKLKTSLNYKIECYPFGSLQRFEVKAKRLKDLREKHKEGVNINDKK